MKYSVCMYMETETDRQRDIYLESDIHVHEQTDRDSKAHFLQDIQYCLDKGRRGRRRASRACHAFLSSVDLLTEEQLFEERAGNDGVMRFSRREKHTERRVGMTSVAGVPTVGMKVL